MNTEWLGGMGDGERQGLIQIDLKKLVLQKGKGGDVLPL